MTATDVARILRAARFHFGNEEQLHDGLAAALERAGHQVEREVILPAGRIDLLAGTVGIEVKVGGARSDVQRQLTRYAACDAIDELVLVTTRATHRMPQILLGKPVEVVALGGGRL